MESTFRTVGSEYSSYTITRRLAPRDKKLVYRLVGFYEYLNALRNFDALLRMVNPAELEMINKLIKEADEYAIYTNLSRTLQKKPSSLAEREQEAGDQFERRGLEWIMALARVELGAMLATYTPTKKPFEEVRPSKFEMPAYKELLEDGLRTHYWALWSDPAAAKLARKTPRSITVAYVRRIALTLHFFNAVAKVNQGNLSPVQQVELKAWRRYLDDMWGTYVANIEDYLAGERYWKVTPKEFKKMKSELLYYRIYPNFHGF